MESIGKRGVRLKPALSWHLREQEEIETFFSFWMNSMIRSFLQKRGNDQGRKNIMKEASALTFLFPVIVSILLNLFG